MYTVLHSQWCTILCQSPINNSGKVPVWSRQIQKTSEIPCVHRWTIQVPKGESLAAFTIIYTLYAHVVFIGTYSEMFEASRWHSDERFFAPMITHKNGDHIFVGDTVNFQEPGHGPCYGKVVKFMLD